VACGTAWHAGLMLQALVKSVLHMHIDVELASEFMYSDPIINENTLLIAVSQSGETVDTLEAVKYAKKKGAKCLAVLNVRGSAIARESDYVLYTEAGPEIAVASTKAYVSQVYILSLIAMKIGIDNGSIDKDKIIYEYNKLPQYIDKLINLDYKEIVKSFYQDKDIFFLGRNIDYASVLEGSLKLKEISYIHSEAYPSGELKHGTISLIEDNTCVMSLITHDETATKTISNIKEVKARGAYVLLLIKDSLNNNIDEDCYDDMIVINDTYFLTQPILNVIPMQLIAYYVAKLRGCDIDKPRNLAKSVTVE
jgi:glucosamine--fructose-6-phosphate aminotransferase (isomerizing)